MTQQSLDAGGGPSSAAAGAAPAPAGRPRRRPSSRGRPHTPQALPEASAAQAAPPATPPADAPREQLTHEHTMHEQATAAPTEADVSPTLRAPSRTRRGGRGAGHRGGRGHGAEPEAKPEVPVTTVPGEQRGMAEAPAAPPPSDAVAPQPPFPAPPEPEPLPAPPEPPEPAPTPPPTEEFAGAATAPAGAPHGTGAHRYRFNRAAHLAALASETPVTPRPERLSTWHATPPIPGRGTLPAPTSPTSQLEASPIAEEPFTPPASEPTPVRSAETESAAPAVPAAARVQLEAAASMREDVPSAASPRAEAGGSDMEAGPESEGAGSRRRRRRRRGTTRGAAEMEAEEQPMGAPRPAAMASRGQQATEMAVASPSEPPLPRDNDMPLADASYRNGWDMPDSAAAPREPRNPYGSPEPAFAHGFGPQAYGVAGPPRETFARAARTAHGERDMDLPPMSANQLSTVITGAIQKQTDRLLTEFHHQQTPPSMTVMFPPLPSTERVGVFVDVANLLYSARSLHLTVDFGRLLEFLRGNRRLVRAHAYAPTSPEPSAEQSFLAAVKGLGYRITTKNYKTFASGAKKADLDLDLCMDIVRLVDAEALDTVSLVSGDSDFLPLLEYCSDHGVRVEVAAFEDAAAAILRQGCDLFINLSLVDAIRA